MPRGSAGTAGRQKEPPLRRGWGASLRREAGVASRAREPFRKKHPADHAAPGRVEAAHLPPELSIALGQSTNQ